MDAEAVLSCSSKDTHDLGARLSGLLHEGDVVLLRGNLGAGKSELARGIAAGLGVRGPVTSPTFTLLNLYETGRGYCLKHFDWYRIEDPEELVLAGLDEQIGGEGITLIEWQERAPELVPGAHLDIELVPLAESQRRIIIKPSPAFRAIDLSCLYKGVIEDEHPGH